MEKDIGYSTLNWVRQEIDETLKQARHSLEEYVENPHDETLLRFCLTYIHQVYGTLQMVELYGAALLAEEMELLTRGLLDRSVAPQEEHFEVLMRAILQLPDYLERIQSGLKDDPLILLPLLNDLRAARGEKLLSENALFAPDLESAAHIAVAPVAEEEPADARKDLLQARARKLRPHYQVGLLGWYRDQQPRESLARLRTILAKLEAASSEENVVRLWWVAGGVVEALLDGGLKASVALKLLLGQLDREIKRLVDHGEEALAEAPSVDLLKNLLYYVARSSSSGERVSAVKEAFNLAGALPTEEEVATARAHLGGPNAELLETVSEAIREELNHVKDALDLYLRSEERNGEGLQMQINVLRKIADTLGMLGMGAPRRVVLEQQKILDDLLSGQTEPSEAMLMEVAGALLFVESSLEGLMRNHLAPSAASDETAEEVEEIADAAVSDAEFETVVSVALKEMGIDIANAKDAIVAFIDSPWDHRLLAEVPGLFDRTAGAMRLLSMDRAAGLFSRVAGYIRDELISRRVQPDQETLDNLADAIAGIEYYLEAIAERRADRDSILDFSEESLVRLEGLQPVPSAPPPAEEQEGVVEGSAAVSSAEEEAPPPEVDSDLLPAGEEAVDEEESESPTELTPVDEPLQEEGPTAESTLSEAEPEEEPTAELEGVPEAAEAEAEGSPTLLMEAPSFEEEEPTAEIPTLVGEAGISTPEEERAEADEGREEPTQEIEFPEEEEATVAPPHEERESPPAATEAERPTVPSPADAAPLDAMAGALPADIDEDILEIFVEEAEEELAVIRELLPLWRQDVENHSSLTRIRRAFHTLKGSGRLVGAVAIGELAWSMENMLNRVLDFTIPATDAMFSLLDEATQVLPLLVARLRGETTPPIDVQDLIDRGFALVEAEKQAARHPVEESYPPEETVSSEETLPENPPLAMEETLQQIFTQESLGHLEEVVRFIANLGVQNQVTDPLVRSLHTLHGSARMAGAAPIAEVAGLLEKLAKAQMANGTPMEGEYLALLKDGMAVVGEMLDLINRVDRPLPDTSVLLEKIGILLEHELEREAQGGSGQPEMAQEAPYDVELVEIFVEEAAEILDALERVLGELRHAEDSGPHLERLQREIHTLKGSARMAGVESIGDLSHAMENVLTDVVEGRLSPSSDLWDLLQEVVDRLFGMIETVVARQMPPRDDSLLARLESFSATPMEEGEPTSEIEAGAEVGEAVEAPSATPEVEEAEEEPARPFEKVVPFPLEPAAEIPPVQPPHRPAEEAPQKKEERGERVRVAAELLDNLVNFAGETSIYRARLEQQNSVFRFNLDELQQTIFRLRDQLRKFEIETEAQILFRHEQTSGADDDFDPLEMDRYSYLQQLSRSLMESVDDIASIEGLLANLVRESESLLVQQSRVINELQEGLMRTRMVPISRLAPRLQRLVRQTARELGKEAKLVVAAQEGEIDRTVLERLAAPLEHMLRNALSHGIEAPAERERAGKSRKGTITLGMVREGAEVVITIADDGAGMDLDAIRAKAVERGLLAEGAQVTDHDIMQFILESGFSTADEVTQIAGRGVGMDVVNSELKQIGGVLSIDSERGRGTTFTIRLPFTLALNQALLVVVGEDLFAIPLTSIEGVVRLSREDLRGFLEQPERPYEYAGNRYDVRRLSDLLGLESRPMEEARWVPVLLVRSGDHRVALQVDGLMGSREIVVKSVGAQLSTVRGLAGATILADGRVVLILDVGGVIRLDATSRARQPAEPAPPVEAVTERRRPLVMVVDDSITVRKVTSRLLQRHDMDVITAKDGVDAVALLWEQQPDVMLLDIEMPRMDGFELATHVRNEERLRDIPIIMITSRAGEKHRRRAKEIGVDRYLGKPYQESDLLEAIDDLVGVRHGDA